jgi:hypothetical protein
MTNVVPLVIKAVAPLRPVKARTFVYVQVIGLPVIHNISDRNSIMYLVYKTLSDFILSVAIASTADNRYM